MTDQIKVRKQSVDLPEIVYRDAAYQNDIRNSDKQNARSESDRSATNSILTTVSSGVE